jgi:hypothetical protein
VVVNPENTDIRVNREEPDRAGVGGGEASFLFCQVGRISETRRIWHLRAILSDVRVVAIERHTPNCIIWKTDNNIG